jgi:DNA polymerase-4
MEAVLTRQAGNVAERLVKHGLSGRTISIKVRLYDFTTLSRSTTLPSPTDHAATIARLARTLLADLDPTGGVRLLGVGVSGLADWVQDDLFGAVAEPAPDTEAELAALPARTRAQWWPGQDVEHTEMGRGWVWGAGSGVVTVRFETAETGPGPVRSFKAEDPDLSPWPRPAPAD